MLPGQMVSVVILSALASLVFVETEACNEAVCASVVSKCQLTESCKCSLKDCTCCHECFTCLGSLYDECCSCVDMCPKRKESDSLSTKSHVEDFQDPIPELFTSLMSEPDPLGRWRAYTFPVDIDTRGSPMFSPKFDQPIKLRTKNEQEVAPRKDTISINCTVAYMSKCSSWNKCKLSCQSTGASKYRWFHDGCCECIGDSCISYGSEKSLCSECPSAKLPSLDDEDNSAFYYDDEMDYTLDSKTIQQQGAEASRV